MSMKLTGKCLESFISFMCKNYPEIKWHEYETVPKCILNALVVEFFDSVGVRIGIDPYYDMSGTYRANIAQLGFQAKSRTEATNEAIIKANELYNEKL